MRAIMKIIVTTGLAVSHCLIFLLLFAIIQLVKIMYLFTFIAMNIKPTIIIITFTFCAQSSCVTIFIGFGFVKLVWTNYIWFLPFSTWTWFNRRTIKTMTINLTLKLCQRIKITNYCSWTTCCKWWTRFKCWRINPWIWPKSRLNCHTCCILCNFNTLCWFWIANRTCLFVKC